MPDTPLGHALELARQGFAVFPVNFDKTPRTPNSFKAASTDPVRIRAMASQYGFPLVGVATGQASNLAALDIDRQHNGAEWWKAHRDSLPETFTYRTRSGGLHLWFRHKPGLRCSTARIAPASMYGQRADISSAGLPQACLPSVMRRFLGLGQTGSHLAPRPMQLRARVQRWKPGLPPI